MGLEWRRSVATEQPLKLNVVLSQQDGCWVATCTELGVVTADPDMETAWEDATRVCRAHLLYGMRTGRSLKDLLKPPPDNIDEIMAQAQEDGTLIINLRPQVAPQPRESVEIHRFVHRTAA
jgi:hypothetical protein